VASELVFTATYCEQENIEAWVRGVHLHRPEADILVVDDSSPDDTGTILKRLQAEIPQLSVHTRPGKMGLSSAHLYAIDRGIAGCYDRVVTMDADGSHQPSQIARLIEASGSADFVIGTRYRGGSHQAAAFFIECLEVMNNDGLVLAEAPIDFLDRTGGKSKIPRSQILLSAKALLHLNRQRRHAPAIASVRADSG
jgi:glycosyltransferase involved in cell wall biosynthesis